VTYRTPMKDPFPLDDNRGWQTALTSEAMKARLDRLERLTGVRITNRPGFQYHSTHYNIFEKVLVAAGADPKVYKMGYQDARMLEAHEIDALIRKLEATQVPPPPAEDPLAVLDDYDL
jgi:hypothetical protein